jgi:DNA processing protein
VVGAHQTAAGARGRRRRHGVGSGSWRTSALTGQGVTVERVFAPVAEPIRDVRDQAALLALTEACTSRPWYEVADVVQEAGRAMAVLDGTATFIDGSREAELARFLVAQTTEEMVERWTRVIRQTMSSAPGVRLLTVLDEDYPANLRRIYNRPPFLFVRGTLEPADTKSVAVVGTRKASPDGLRMANEMARTLAERGVTVISGMAAGVDTEAHTAALDAGGRTIAVMGTGIDKVYPAANRGLARRIAEHGALLSQFWPGSPPRGTNFPLRNVVTSGMAVGTVVIEANATSGAKMQARLALEHGKRLFLIKSLVMHEEWAGKYAQRPGALVVDDVDDVMGVLESERQPVTELQLF